MPSAPDNQIWIRFYKDGIFSGEITFAQTEQAIEKKKEEFSALGLRAGDRVIVKMRNSIDTVITYLALVRAQLIAVPVHPKETEGRLSFVQQHSGAAGMLTEGGYVALPKTARTANAEGVDIIMYTSGTTGEPKGVCLSWQNWVANAEMLIAHHGLGPDTTLAGPLPLSHCNAYGLSMVATYLSKARWILFDGISHEFLTIAAAEKATIISIVPAILHGLVEEHPDWQPYPELRYILTAAAPLSAQLLTDVLDHWGVRVIQGYGLTESTNFSCTVPTDLSEEEYRAVMFPQPSIGVALPGVEIRIGATDEEGVVGELSVRAATNASRYWGKEDKPSEWLATGDLALYRTFGGRKFYYHRGRLKEIINRGGEKISPIELENEMRSLGIGGACAVISIPHEVFGEEVALACVGAVDTELFKKIPEYRRPKKVFIVPELFATPTGKLQRAKIRDYCLRPDA